MLLLSCVLYIFDINQQTLPQRSIYDIIGIGRLTPCIIQKYAEAIAKERSWPLHDVKFLCRVSN